MEEYRWILQNKTEQTQEEFLGDVSHNLGTAYANLFLFTQAADSYRMAYEKNTNPISQKAEIFCLLLAGEEQTERAKDYGIGAEQAEEYEKELQEIRMKFHSSGQAKRIRTLCESYEKKPKEEIKSEIHEIVHTWRNEYKDYGR